MCLTGLLSHTVINLYSFYYTRTFFPFVMSGLLPDNFGISKCVNVLPLIRSGNRLLCWKVENVDTWGLALSLCCFSPFWHQGDFSPPFFGDISTFPVRDSEKSDVRDDCRWSVGQAASTKVYRNLREFKDFLEKKVSKNGFYRFKWGGSATNATFNPRISRASKFKCQ